MVEESQMFLEEESSNNSISRQKVVLKWNFRFPTCIAYLIFILLSAEIVFSANDIEQLIAKLKERDWIKRQRMIRELCASSDPRVVEVLKSALKDEHEINRSIVAAELAKRGYNPAGLEEKIDFLVAQGAWNEQLWNEINKIGKRAVPYLLHYLQDGSPNVRLYCARALERLGFTPTNAEQHTLFLIAYQRYDEIAQVGPEATPVLIPFIEKHDDNLKSRIFLILAEIGDHRAVDPIINFVYQKYDHQDMCWSAITALGKLGDKRAINVLIPCLFTSYRSYAADALEKLGYIPRNEKEKIEFLIGKGDFDEVAKMGQTAMQTLFLLMTSPRETYHANEIATILNNHGFQPEEDWAKVLFLLALKKKNELLRMGDVAVRCLYQRLGNICDYYEGNPDYIDPLMIEILGELKYKPAVSLMVKALKGVNMPWFTESGKLAKSLAIALADIGEKEAISALVQVLPKWEANEEIGKALEQIGWRPCTDAEQVYYWICKKDINKLQENWKIAKEVLINDFASNNYNKMENAIYTFAWLNREEVIPELIDIFYSTGDLYKLQLFIRVGHPKLIKAVKEWETTRRVRLLQPPKDGYLWQLR